MKKWVLAVLAVCVLAAAAAGVYFGGSSAEPNSGGAGMSEKAAEPIRAYFFYSEYCPHCENVKPLVDAAAEKLNLTYCCVDGELSDECYIAARENSVYAVPTMIVYKGGNKTVLVGEDEIKSFLSRFG